MGTTHSTNVRGLGPRAPVTALSAEEIDFNDADEVDKFRRALVRSEALQGFCERFFDGVDVPATALALINLRLYTLADEQHVSKPAIAQSRSDARAIVSNRLSSAGKDELLQAVDANIRESAFVQYLADADLRYLIGPVWFAHGDVLYDAKAFAQAAHVFAKAARAFQLSDQPERAAHAWTAAARAYELAGLPNQAKDAWGGAAGAWEADAIAHDRMARDRSAAAAYREAAHAYEQADMLYEAANARWSEAKHYDLPEQQVGALLAAGDGYVQAGWFADAARAYKMAAQIFAQLKFHVAASDAYRQQANVLMLLKQYDSAAWAYENAAAVDTLADLLDQAKQARIKAADAHSMYAQAPPPDKLPLRVYHWGWAGRLYMMEGLPKQAAEAYDHAAVRQNVAGRDLEAAENWCLAGSAYWAAEMKFKAAVVWRLAAYAYIESGLFESAAKAFHDAVHAYESTNQPALAQAVGIEAQAAAHHGKGEHALTAKSHKDAALAYSKMQDFYEAAKANERAAKSLTLAEEHLLAAKAFVEAANIYRQDEMFVHAGQAEEAASHAYYAAGLEGEAQAAREKAKVDYAHGGQTGRTLRPLGSAELTLPGTHALIK